MTIIITIKEEDNVWLGSDRMISYTTTKTTTQTPKYFKKEFQTYNLNKTEDETGHIEITKNNFKKHNLIFAGAGSDAINNYIKYAFRFPDKIESDPFETYLLIDVLPVLKEELATVGLLKTQKGGANDTEANFLIIYDNEVYPIFRDMGYSPRTDDYTVIGVADEIALGSLHATKKLSPIERIEKTLEACSYPSLYVSKEKDIIKITSEDYK